MRFLLYSNFTYILYMSKNRCNSAATRSPQPQQPRTQVSSRRCHRVVYMQPVPRRYHRLARATAVELWTEHAQKGRSPSPLSPLPPVNNGGSTGHRAIADAHIAPTCDETLIRIAFACLPCTGRLRRLPVKARPPSAWSCGRPETAPPIPERCSNVPPKAYLHFLERGRLLQLQQGLGGGGRGHGDFGRGQRLFRSLRDCAELRCHAELARLMARRPCAAEQRSGRSGLLRRHPAQTQQLL